MSDDDKISKLQKECEALKNQIEKNRTENNDTDRTLLSLQTTNKKKFKRGLCLEKTKKTHRQFRNL
jgi:hypothetical protein